MFCGRLETHLAHKVLKMSDSGYLVPSLCDGVRYQAKNQEHCWISQPHPPHVFQRESLYYCPGVSLPTPRLKHKHILRVKPHKNRNNTKLIKMECEECGIVYFYGKSSIHKIVKGAARFNYQMIKTVDMNGIRN